MKTKKSGRSIPAGGAIVPMLPDHPASVGFKNEADPIVAAIGKHRVAWQQADTLSKINQVFEEAVAAQDAENSDHPDHAKRLKKAKRVHAAADRAFHEQDEKTTEAWDSLVATVPTTRAGCLALFDYIAGEITASGNFEYYFTAGREGQLEEFFATIRASVAQFSI